MFSPIIKRFSELRQEFFFRIIALRNFCILELMSHSLIFMLKAKKRTFFLYEYNILKHNNNQFSTFNSTPLIYEAAQSPIAGLSMLFFFLLIIVS